MLDLTSTILAFKIIPTNLSPMNLILIFIGLVILWIIVSIPVYIAGKIVTAGKSTFAEAMVATLFGPIVFIIVLTVVDFFLGEIIGTSAFIWAYILAFIAWLWVYKASFHTGWLRALALAIIAVIVFVVLSIILGAIFGIIVPAPFFPSPL